MKQRCRMAWLVTVVVLLAMIGTTATSVMTVTADDSAQTIKVGYIVNYGIIQTPMIKGSEGYGYEYLYQILEYTEGNYDLEFIQCDLESAEEMLQSGEIDIFGPVTQTEARQEEYLFTDQSFGTSYVFLSTLTGQEAFFDSYDELDGRTVSIYTNNSNAEYLEAFLDENDLDMNIEYFSGTDFSADLTQSEREYYLTDSMITVDGLSDLINLGSYEFYYMFSDSNQALVDDFNQAMEQLSTVDYLFQEKLFLEYYDREISENIYVTEAEQALIQDSVYQVGVTNLYGPTAYEDSNGELTGISVDIVQMIADLGRFSVEFVDLEENPDAEVDFSILALDDNARLNASESDIYCDLALMLIDKETDDEIETIGTIDYYGIESIILEDHLYGRTIVEYANAEELRAGFDAGEVDSMILTTATLNAIRANIETESWLSTPIDATLSLTLTFTDSFSNEKISIINKLIAQLDATEIEAIVLQHAALEDSTAVTARAFFEENPMLIFTIVFAFMAMVFMLERKRRIALDTMLNVDDLTGLRTQHKFILDATKTLKEDPRNEYALISVDIDNFKYINEIYGYAVGSSLLKKLGNFIQSQLVAGALVTRCYADNFLIFAKAENTDARLTDALENTKEIFKIMYADLGETYNFSISIGVYQITDRSLDFSYMIDCCNIARGMGKGTVGTTINRFSSRMDQIRSTNNEIVANMEHALRAHEFIMHYQPKVDLATEKITGVEALVRWQRGGTVVPPNEFIPLFEKNGFIERLDFYVLEQVCQFIADNPLENLPRISVNISGITIMQPDVVKNILDVLEHTGVSATMIDIEITETAFVEQFDRAKDSIALLRELGCTISMDDFGAGISSLNRLREISVDIIKIDREFIINSLSDEKGSTIIRNILKMAKSLHLETVAEGVETPAQCAFLKQLGCDVAQGYYYFRPMSAADFLKQLKATSK